MSARKAPAARISYAEAVKQWKHAATGGDAMKIKAEEKFKQYWMEKFRGGEPAPHDTVPIESYQILVRELVIGVLSGSSGLQLKLSQSKDGDEIFCRVRAPLQVLERQADLLKYPLRFKGEVDPGPAFWTEDECREDSSEGPRMDNTYLSTREDAEKVLQKLYEVGKISPHDIEVFEDEQKPKWMARVHALERAADKVPVNNPFPAFAPFNRTKSIRYVFEQYDSTRGPTLFQPKDRLFLTQSIMRRYMDLDILDDYDAIKGSMALHDANRGEYDDIELLRSQWVFPLTANKKDVGAVLISDPAIDGDDLPSPLAWLWCQPLSEIRNYFGEEVGFYFAWLGHLSYSYLFPAALGLACQVYYMFAGYSWCDTGLTTGTYFQMVTGVGTVLWAIVYKNQWAAQQKLLAVKWGTRGFEAEEKDRPQFRGSEYVRDPVTLREVLHYPDGKRAPLILWSNVLVLGLVVALLAEIDLLMYMSSEMSSQWAIYLVFALFAAQIPVFSAVATPLCEALAESENHQTQSAFTDALIVKSATFEFMNRYGPLLYQAFAKDYTYGCRAGCCMGDLAELLGFIFAVQGVTTVYSSLQPAVAKRWREYVEYNQIRQAAAMKEAMADDDQLDSEGLVNKLEPWEKEIGLLPFHGFFYEYLKRTFNFGYATMFVVAFPAAPVIALVITTIHIRVMAYQFTSVYRRPAPERQEDIGLWQQLMGLMCTAALLTNCGILVFTSNSFKELSVELRCVVFLAMVQGLKAVQSVVEVLVPTETPTLRDIIGRHEYLIEKHIWGFQDTSSASKGPGGGKGGEGGGGGAGAGAGGDVAKRGHIDLGALEEQLLKKAESASAKDGGVIPEIAEVDHELESVQRELVINKDRLVTALKTEVYNEKTGIGETIHGLPLGCISLKLIMMEGVAVSAAKNVSVVVSLKSTKRDDTSAPGPPAQVSKSGRPNLANAKKEGIDFNQTFTLAPVKSHDAQLIFDIMDSGSDPKRRGTCKVHLRDLADQLDSNKTLPVLVRSTATGSDGKFEPDPNAKLFARVKFQYSKVLPLRTKIYELQDQERTLRAKKTALRLSKSKE